jgi:hypothetical protein
MSKYVCGLVSDVIIAFGSGCSPYRWRNLAEGKDNPLQLLSAGVGGVTEAVGSSITDLSNDYGNAKLDTMIGGGVSGVAQKACMAALGYEWELSINDIMDAAYSTEFASNVMAPTLRRNYLFTNPTTRQPVYEYRGGLYITPGCDIDGYTAQLVCVNRAEKTKYPNSINCIGDYVCACLNANLQTPAAYNLPISSTGKMTQSVPMDKTFHQVADGSAYVYDHLKVELIFADANKKKKCLPDTNQDGIFYFPIADQTPFNLIGCEIVPTSGTLLCKSGISKELGFGNLIISSIQMGDSAVVGQSFKFSPMITKTGTDTVCLKYRVYKGDPDNGGTQFGEDTVVQIQTEYSSQYLTPLDVFGRLGSVPSTLLGTGAGALIAKYELFNLEGKPITGYSANWAPVSTSKSTTLTVYLKKGTSENSFNCGSAEYSSPNNNDYTKLTGSCTVSNTYGGVQITSLSLPPTNANDNPKLTPK